MNSSEIRDLYQAYSAVHNPEVRETLTEARDEISVMSLASLTTVDLQDIAEEILEELFAKGMSSLDAGVLVEYVLEEVLI